MQQSAEKADFGDGLAGATRQEQVEGHSQGWSRVGEWQGLPVQQVHRVRLSLSLAESLRG